MVPPDRMPKLPLTIDSPLAFDSSKSRAFVDFSGDGKKATTIVNECREIMEDGTAIVVLKILTGRKHQIRAHLQTVGMPIANDTRYGGRISMEVYSAFGMPNRPIEVKTLYESNFVEGCQYCNFSQDVLSGQKGIGPCVSNGIWLHCWTYQFPTLGLSFESLFPHWAISLK